MRVRSYKRKKGKLDTSHRYDLLPLLRSSPGGIQRELVVYDFPTANVDVFFGIAKKTSIFLLCVTDLALSSALQTCGDPSVKRVSDAVKNQRKQIVDFLEFPDPAASYKQYAHVLSAFQLVLRHNLTACTTW